MRVVPVHASDVAAVTVRDGYDYFSDCVVITWANREAHHGDAFSTRWRGAMERRGEGDAAEWLFVGMHVSTPYVG